MKKIISFLMAAVLVLSLGIVSFADEITEYSWAETESIAKQSLGEGNTWDVEEVDASFWLPAEFTPIELTAEDIADGSIGFYSVPDGGLYVMLNYAESEGLTLDSYMSYFQQNGADIYKLSINGIPAIYLREPENDSAILVFQTQAGKFFQVVFSPLTAEKMFQYTVISIRPREEEAPGSAALVFDLDNFTGKAISRKMEAASQTFLVSAKVMYSHLIELDDVIDYSGVCVLVTKALEMEIKKRF